MTSNSEKAKDTFTNLGNWKVNLVHIPGSKNSDQFKNGPVKTVKSKTTLEEGGEGWLRTAKGELFILAATLLNDDTYYESKEDRVIRVRELVERVNDPEWTYELVKWLRGDGGLRTAAQMVAVPASAYDVQFTKNIKATVGNNVQTVGWARKTIRAGIGRLDEVMTTLGLWLDTYGKPIPSAVKRGVADALVDLTNEYSYLKYRNHTKSRFDGNRVSLRDAILMTHPKAKNAKQDKLFKIILDEAYGADDVNYDGLDLIQARNAFNKLNATAITAALSTPKEATDLIRGAGLTHEVIAGKLGKIPVSVWMNLIPTMGYQALRMNLRRIKEQWNTENDDNTSYFKDSKLYREICNRMNDGAGYKAMPMEFLSAYNATDVDFNDLLEKEVGKTIDNVPALDGKTLILVDSSGSMNYGLMSNHSTLKPYDVAKTFASALALRAEDADVYTFDAPDSYYSNGSDGVYSVDLHDVSNILKADKKYPLAGGGTDIKNAVNKTYRDHDRVIIITDEQSKSSDVLSKVPDNVPVFIWNIGGYRGAVTDERPGRWTLTSLTDASFKLIPELEAGGRGVWPWEINK